MGETTFEFDHDDCSDEKEDYLDLIRAGLSEFGCLFVIVFISCMGCITGMSGTNASALQLSITGGLSVMTAMQIFGHISGAHCNPSVTISAFLMDVIDAKKTIIYMICQVFGALTGYAAILYVTPKTYMVSDSVCVTLPSEKISAQQAFTVEFIITFILCIAINSCWDKRCMKKLDSFALRIGLVVTACALAAGPYTGASMNPARSIGPALWQKNYEALHIYIFAPLLGGASSGLFYKHLFLTHN